MPDEVAGTPLLAVLSTVVLDADDFRSVSAVLMVGLLDEGDEVLGSGPEWFGIDLAEAGDGDDETRSGSVR